MSISPTLYARLFRNKVSREALLYLDLRFVHIWRKNIGAKAARNILVKLTLGFCSLKSFEEAANGIIKKNETIDYFATTGVNWCSYEQITLVRFCSLSLIWEMTQRLDSKRLDNVE